jgi:DNA-binding transcriptional LysR family regulator
MLDVVRLRVLLAVSRTGSVTAAELAAHVGLRAGRVRLAAFPSALGTFVPEAAVRLAHEHPGLDLRLAEAEPPEALRMLRAGDVDVAVIFQYGSAGGAQERLPYEGTDADGLRMTPLLDEPSLLVVPGTGSPATALPDHAESRCSPPSRAAENRDARAGRHFVPSRLCHL